MLKKLALLRCERTAKISHLFQSCKHFFKNFAFFDKSVFPKGRTAVHRERNSRSERFNHFVKNLIFSNAVAKVATFSELANILSTFFKKIFFGTHRGCRKTAPTYIYRSPRLGPLLCFLPVCRSSVIPLSVPARTIRHPL